MADPLVAKNFLLDTDYPLDKIIYLYEGSFTVAASGIGSSAVLHNLPFIPLTNMVWSTTPDFSISYMAGSGPSATNPALYQLGIDASVTASATTNTVDVTNFFTIPVAIYYRLYSFEPSDSSADLEPTANEGDPFVLNTDYNYTKLYIEGKLTLASSTTVVHDLGYIPQIETWIGAAATNYPPQQFVNLLDSTASVAIGSVGIIATTTTLQVIGTIPSAVYLHYRIYLDE